MINGAMRIFAQNGYDHASTDDMVKATGVSKGLWFYYFESKSGLFCFVATYVMRYAALEYSMLRIESDEDYFSVRMKIEQCKMKMIDLYPYLPLFLVELHTERSPEVRKPLKDVVDKYETALETVLVKCDFGKLQERTDMLRVLRMLDYSLDAILRDCYASSEVFSKEQYLKEAAKYIETAKELTL